MEGIVLGWLFKLLHISLLLYSIHGTTGLLLLAGLHVSEIRIIQEDILEKSVVSFLKRFSFCSWGRSAPKESLLSGLKDESSLELSHKQKSMQHDGLADRPQLTT